MTLDVEPRSDRIATGRTWRDIPPEPPRVAPPVEPAAAAPRLIEQPPWRWRAAALVGLVALAAGVAFGAWSPWRDRGTAAAAAQAPESSTTLPESIVPPSAATVPPDTLLPEDFFGLDGLPGFSDFFGTNPDALGRLAPAGLDLIELTDLPEGYRVQGTSYSTSGDEAAEQIRLRGPDGTVTITAVQSPDAELPAGESLAIGGTEGRLTEGDPIVLSWMPAADLLVTIEAPAGTGRDFVEVLAAAVEVTP